MRRRHTSPGVYIEETGTRDRTIEAVPTSVTAFVGGARLGPVNAPVPIRAFSEFEKTFGGVSPTHSMGLSVHQFFENGGTDAVIVRVNPADGGVAASAIEGSRAGKTGIFALEDAPEFNLLVIPPLDEGTDVPPSTWALAAQYAAVRRAMLLVDPPSSWTGDPSTAVREAESGIRDLGRAIGNDHAPNTAVYFPRLRVVDPLSRAPRACAPTGAVAGIIASTDRTRGVWKAPAGPEARFASILGFDVDISDVDNGRLNPLGLNCLREFPGVGHVVWGSRTLAGRDDLGSEWKYVPVRRLFLFMEESIHRGIEWVVFEPNGEPLWSKIRQSVGAFLQTLWHQGAFQGTKDNQAYFVKCDRETTTQNDIDQGIVNIVIGFAPLKPAEFVIFRIGQKTASSRSSRRRTPK